MTAPATAVVKVTHLVASSGRATGTLEVANDPSVFDGHYPGRAVVPGVVIVDAVIHVGRAMTGHQFWDIASASFREVVQPPATLTITADRNADETLTASCRRDGATVATVRLRRSAPPP